MGKHVFLFGIAVFILFFLAPTLGAQESPIPTAKKKDTQAVPDVLEIIKLAESKLYSPMREGLKDLFFTRELTGQVQITSYWCKAPDKIKAIYGRPVKKSEIKGSAAIRLSKPIAVETRIPNIVAERLVGRLTGTPISCLLPYGTFQIIKKDSGGIQLRFTSEAENPKDLMWSNIDFFLDSDFRLTKTMQKILPDGRIEESKIRLKPYKEGAELLIFDSESLQTLSEKKTFSTECRYQYEQYDSFWLVKEVVFDVKGDSKNYYEKYVDYRVNAGIDDEVFEEED